MVHGIDILDWDKLVEHIERKEITERHHPEFPELAIFNYADIVQITGNWTHETRTARGLIINLDTNEVLARPFAKFFNYGQEKVDYDLDAPLYHVGNKYDGSLGIVYRRPDGRLAVATRGSFESEQAQHATEHLSDVGHPAIEQIHNILDAGYTPLYEIVYPENRIVVDYGATDDLIYLGMVNNETGAYHPPRSEQREGQILSAVLARPDRPNAEGWVVWIDPHTAVKIKQQDYIELHRIVTGLNRKSVWRALSNGEDEFKALLEQLPDELYAWAEGVAKELREEYAAIMREVDMWYVCMLDTVYAEYDYQDFDRKFFAQKVAKVVPSDYRGFMFAMLDKQYGRVQDKIFKMIEPSGSER